MYSSFQQIQLSYYVAARLRGEEGGQIPQAALLGQGVFAASGSGATINLDGLDFVISDDMDAEFEGGGAAPDDQCKY